MESKIESLIQIARKAALEAGKKVIGIYEQDQIAFEIKNDLSPLTAADTAANLLISQKLQETRLPLLSEEGLDIAFEERSGWGLYWLVDPLDGSKEFLKKNGEFTINIALMQDAVPLAGVVYAPCLNVMYSSSGPGRAYKVKNGVSQRLEVKEPKKSISEIMALNTVRVVASRSHLNKETTDFISRFQKTELLSMGSSLKFMLLADDLADIYPRIAPTMEWDTAAAHAILLGVNKNIYDANTGLPLPYNKRDLTNKPFIAF